MTLCLRPNIFFVNLSGVDTTLLITAKTVMSFKLGILKTQVFYLYLYHVVFLTIFKLFVPVTLSSIQISNNLF